MQTVIVTMNEKVTLTVGTALLDLKRVIRHFDPDLVFLQEWSRERDPATKEWARCHGYVFCRAAGGPVLYRKTRYTFLWKTSPLLSKAGFVGVLPGRRSNLGNNYATRVGLFDHFTGKNVSAIDFHLDAEVQDGLGGYKRDVLHIPRVLRHHIQKRRLGRTAREDKKAGLKVFVAGDGNFHGMRLGGFVNCWDRYPGAATLGKRAVDIVFATRPPVARPRILHTRSDHDAVCVTYR